jgi:hypothetical protein
VQNDWSFLTSLVFASKQGIDKGGPWNGKSWNILWPIGILKGSFAFLMDIW